MLDRQYLWDDDTLRRFIVDGYCVVKADYPKAFHDEIYLKTEEVFAKEGNPGNNLLPRIPAIQRVFDHPAVRGALTSLLGPTYIMHSHRHPHINPPESKGGGWHKDSYWGYHKVRDHHPRWIMAMYYPQDVTIENGPTGVIPGTHYFESRVEDPDAEGIPLCGEAGSVIIIHFDLWHRAFPNGTKNNRYMMKFQFTRMREPDAPHWRNASDALPLNDLASSPRREMWSAMWRYLAGRMDANGHGTDKAASRTLARSLREASEAARLHAAYALAEYGEPAIPHLIDALQEAADEVKQAAGYGLGAAGAAAVPALAEMLRHADAKTRGYAVYALGDTGAAAQETVPALALLRDDPSEWVRRNVSEALGHIGRDAGHAVPALIQLLCDADAQVRFNAGYALAKFGPEAAEAVPALTAALDDENRYVQGHAATALERIGTPEAVDALMRLFHRTRWCPYTTRESTF